MSEALVEQVIARCQRAGAKQADAVLVLSDAIEVRVRGAEIDFVKQSRERVLGIRALVGDGAGLRTAVTSTSDLSDGVALALADDTVELARATAPDPYAGIPKDGFAENPPELSLCDPADRKLGVDSLIASAREASPQHAVRIRELKTRKDPKRAASSSP
ncbi:MAG: hypothetical protein HKP27_11910 [Myxococcales bacterium]|nr:hypothetical protein [Myxococcales bacterium]